ncbi:hypothetical protein I4U23_001630 [Adineta vaga]|nr:hypothetical protein I4U23_001630 [Adineta vaga]
MVHSFIHLTVILYMFNMIVTTEIVTFSATLFDIPIITNDSITLNVELSNCISPCSCHVQMNKTGNYVPVKFHSGTSKGFVVINNLETYTMYSFDLNCSQVNEIKTYTRRTDVSRPSSPGNIQIALHKQRLRLTWTPPNFPHGPIDNYRITIDGIEKLPYLSNTAISYEIGKNYVFGINHTMGVRACNNDSQQRILCSDAKDTTRSFFQDKNSDNIIVSSMQSVSFCRIRFLSICIIQFLMVI